MKNILIKNSKKYVILDGLYIIIFIIFGFLLSLLLNKSQFIFDESITKTTWEIIIHNLIFLFAASILSSLIAYPVIIYNSIALGIVMGLGLYLHDPIEYLIRIKHIPIELLAWIFGLQLSKEIYLIYFRKKRNFKRGLFFLIVAIFFYILGAIIEPL